MNAKVKPKEPADVYLSKAVLSDPWTSIFLCIAHLFQESFTDRPLNWSTTLLLFTTAPLSTCVPFHSLVNDQHILGAIFIWEQTSFLFFYTTGLDVRSSRQESLAVIKAASVSDARRGCLPALTVLYNPRQESESKADSKLHLKLENSGGNVAVGRPSFHWCLCSACEN